MRIFKTALAAAALLLLGPVAMLGTASAKPTAPGVLPADWVATFSSVEFDPKPPELVRNANYVVSNERKVHLFAEPLAKAQGGIYIGVGTDQNYTFAGWSKPEILILMDFDQVVVNVHKAYRVAFETCEDPAAFLAFWAKSNKDASLERIKTFYKDDAETAKDAKQAFKMAQKWVEIRFRRTRKRWSKDGVTTFLDDAGQYAHLRKLWLEKRVYPIRGDLTRDKAMSQIAAAAKKHDVPVRVLYLSNAEQYFKYRGNEFKANLRGLPFDEQSLVVRTMASGSGTYKYYVQPGLVSHKWMERKGTGSVWTMINAGPKLLNDRLYELWREPRVKKSK